MKKSFLPLLALITMASCTQSEMDQRTSEEQVPIMLGANALSVDASTRAPFEGTIGTGNSLKALVIASETANDYTEATGKQYAIGTMNFTADANTAGTLAVPYETPMTKGNSYYPVNGKTLYFTALYPATGWASITTTAEYNFTGIEDVMAAAQTSASKSVAKGSEPKFEFKHLLTKLNIKFVAANAASITAWGKISKIELIKVLGSATIPSKVAVNLEKGGAATSDGVFTLTKNPYPCYGLTADASNVKTYTDVAYAPAGGYTLTETATYQAYTLVAPITAVGTKDFTFRIYAENALETSTLKYVDVDVNLQKTTSGTTTPFTGDTQGKAFDITLKFQAKTIEALATVKGWDETSIDNDPTVVE